MSKVYRRKTGLIIASGKVVNIRSNAAGKEVEIAIRERNRQTKEVTEKVITAISNSVDDDVAVGKVVTAIGYQSGLDIISASSVTAGANVRYVEDIEVVSGPVAKAEFKSETNPDGTPKLKRDGQPRKPHFDVTIKVPDEEGHNVSHRIKIYNFAREREAGEKTEIEKAQAAFSRWVDKDETPVIATIVTMPGTTSSWESEYNGKIYQNFASDHLGKASWDLNWMDEARQPQRNTDPASQINAPVQPQTQNHTQPEPPRTYGSSNIQIEDGDYL